MRKRFNLILFIICIFAAISIFTIIGTSYIDLTSTSLFYKQLLWYVFGFIIIYFVLIKKNSFFIMISKYLYVIDNILLLLLLFIGKPINNARCWFLIPGIGAFQPSEFMKIILILLLTDFFSKHNKHISMKDELSVLIKSFLLVLFPSFLTFLEPDTGNVLIYIIIYISMVFVYRINYRWYIYSFLGIILVFFLGFMFKDSLIGLLGDSFFLRINRILDWKNGNGFQLSKSIIAIGSSGMLGNMHISLYFPESYTDFIFSSYSSMTGFIGSSFLLFLIFYFDYLIIGILFDSSKNNKYLVSGFLGMLIFQQFQNIGMTFGMLPITGITLPFISYGGSSILIFLFMIGIVLNIELDNKKVLNKHF